MDQPSAASSRGCVPAHLTGVIQVEGLDRPVLFRMKGISLQPDETGLRLFGGSVLWFTDEASLLTLNDRIGYE